MRYIEKYLINIINIQVVTLLALAFTGFAIAAENVSANKSQEINKPGYLEEIIVTARKRDETVLEVPVSLTTMNKSDIKRYNTADFISLASQVPSMMVAQSTGGSGGSIALRGVSSTASNPSADQAVSINVDGVSVGGANLLRLGQIDIQQIEILKGPQALFFGKNSPGGVISLRTADPTDYFELETTVGHELDAEETTAQVVISGPLTETLGGRLVVQGIDKRGERHNDAPVVPGLSFGPLHRDAPDREEIFARGTLLYEPRDNLKIRSKYTYDKLDGASPWSTAERIACPNGTPQVNNLGPLIAVDDCKADGHFYSGKFTPGLTDAYQSVLPSEGTEAEMQFVSIDVDYGITEDISITSVTGYYHLIEDTSGNSSYGPRTMIIAATGVTREEISEEIRLSTNFSDSPINFMVGGYVEDTTYSNATPVILDLGIVSPALLGTPTLLYYAENFVDTTAFSFFGQAIWNITDDWELAGGLRWSKEKKELRANKNQGFGGGPWDFGDVPTKVNFYDTSPEVTLKWHPVPEMMMFIGFRNGFKSGGFNTSGQVPTILPDPSYDQEDVRGFEGGIKGDKENLTYSLTAYDYEYKNLQVSTFDPSTVAQIVINGANATLRGVEADFTWQLANIIEGLTMRGSLAYSHARYDDFLVGCYTGQTVAMGCDLTPINGKFTQQDFRDAPLQFAPDWSGSLGFTYSQPISDGLYLGVTADAVFRGDYYADLERHPYGEQSDYATVDASIRLANAAETWEVALIGQNLSDVYRSVLTAQVSSTGNAALTGTTTEGGLSDLNGQIIRGRQIRLQVTAKF